MSRRETTHGTEHVWAVEAMPWRLNQTMNEKDMARLNTHLLECEECRNSFAAEKVLAENLRRAPATLPPQLPSARESLAKLKAERARREQAHGGANELEAARRRRSQPGRWVYGAIAAQAVAIALLAVWTLRPPAPGPEYQTMSSTQSVTVPHLKVEFGEDTTVAQIRNALAVVEGRVVSGPSVAGVFVVVVEDSASADLELRAQNMMDMPGVRFVAVSRGERRDP